MIEEILELPLKAMSNALNELIKECKDNDGKPKEPTYGAIMKASGFLPPYCSEALSKRSRIYK